jgi:hypothetical protein
MESMYGLSRLGKKIILAGAAAICAVTFQPGQAKAAPQNVIEIGQYDHWGAYWYRDSAGIVCYILSRPTKSKGNYTKRGDVYAIVTHRPALKQTNVVSFLAGYRFKENSDVQVKLDGKNSHNLFTHQETAWARTSKTDSAIVSQMKAGAKMLVSGRSWRGTLTTDTYSLIGFTKAYNAISQKCRVR